MSTYISIGNSDDKLSQGLWSAFHHRVNVEVRKASGLVHGHWLSEPSAPWQNACWCVEVDGHQREQLRETLRHVANVYQQDSIAWADAETEFLR